MTASSSVSHHSERPRRTRFNKADKEADDAAKRRRGRPRKHPIREESPRDSSPKTIKDVPAPTEPAAEPPPKTPRTFTTSCPVCSGQIPGDENDAAAHVDECLKRQKEPKSVAKSVPLDDALVNVLDGDESRFGRPQYTDRDIASVLSTISNRIESPKDVSSFRRDSIQALTRTVQLQDQIIQRIPRCLICLDPHRKPVVSTVCWHVFCELCWLQSLATKRICPHCSSITAPEDLRRVYM